MQKTSISVGMIFALLGFMFLALAEVCTKWLSMGYPPMQIIFLKNILSLPLILLLCYAQGKIGDLKTNRMHMHVTRGFISMMSFFFCIVALSMISLADFTIISYTGPFFGIVLAFLILGEKVGLNRLAAIIVGFIGVFIIVQPGGTAFGYGAFVAIIATVFSCLFIIYTRKMAWSETSTAITFWTLLYAMLFSSVFVPFMWQTPNTLDWGVFLIIGVLNILGNLTIAESLKHAPSTLIMPFDYTGLIWAILFGYLIWGDIPSTAFYWGSLLIILAGLYIAIRENLDEKGIQKSVLKVLFDKKKKSQTKMVS